MIVNEMTAVGEQTLRARLHPTAHFDLAASLNFLSESGAVNDLDTVKLDELVRPLWVGERIFRLTLRSGEDGTLLLLLEAPDGDAPPQEADMRRAAEMVNRRFFLDVDMGDVREALSVNAYGEELVEMFWPARPANYGGPWDALLLSVVHAQIYPGFAKQLDDYLRVNYGTRVTFNGEAVHLFPQPHQLAGAPEEDLRSAKFSRQKADYLVSISQTLLHEAQTYDWGRLRALPGEEAVRQLRELRGVGEWTSQNVAMRGLPHPDVFIYEQATRETISEALDMAKLIKKRAFADAVGGFAPYRTFACYYTYMKHFSD